MNASADEKPQPSAQAWQDRWTKPTRQQLLKHLTPQQRKVFDELLKRIEAFDNIEIDIAWYGVAWRWTIQCHWTVAAREEEPFCFLVPKDESPEICIPLTTDMINAMPTRRLNRMVRDGIRVAKCALEKHWATWSPTAMTEVEHLTDLLVRKRKYLEKKHGLEVEPDEEDDKPEKKSKSRTTKRTTKSKAGTKKKSKSTTKSRGQGGAASKKSTSKSTSKATSKKKSTSKKSKSSTRSKRSTKKKTGSSRS